MKPISTKAAVFVEFKENSVHVLDGSEGTEFPFEREAGGRIPAVSIEAIANSLRGFLHRRGSLEGHVFCSIPARGISVRRMSLPVSAGEEVKGLLTLQLEAQLPVPPSELAWGSMPLMPENQKANGGASMRDFLVAAVKKDFFEDYSTILSKAGLQGHFTVAAMARSALCPDSPARFSVLETGKTRSELLSFDERGPASLRVLPWGSDQPSTADATDPIWRSGVGEKLYITGTRHGNEGAMAHLALRIQGTQGMATEFLDGATAPGMTPANLGLRTLVETGREAIFLASHETAAPPRSNQPARWKWVALAAALLACSVLLRYAESIVYRGRLTKKLSAISAYRGSLPVINREFSFLNFIKTNQPPYLDTLAIVAAAAPPGTRIDTVSLVRRGDLSFRGSAGDPQAPGNFRSKLIDSGFFSRVVVEEQTPSPDGQKVSFRISGQLKPDGARRPLSTEPLPKSGASTNQATPGSTTNSAPPVRKKS